MNMDNDRFTITSASQLELGDVLQNKDGLEIVITGLQYNSDGLTWYLKNYDGYPQKASLEKINELIANGDLTIVERRCTCRDGSGRVRRDRG